MSKDIIISIICLVLALAFVAGTIYLLAGNPAPMAGHISRKSYHPEYFPADKDTPLVYCLCITSDNGKKTTNWTVSKEVFDRYSVGDPVRLGAH